MHAFYERELLEHSSYPGDRNPRPFPHPNYAALVPDPGQHVFKNIDRRQRLKDQLEYAAKDNEEGKKAEKTGERLFDTKFIESVRLRHANISMQRSFNLKSEKSGLHVENSEVESLSDAAV